MSVKVPKVESQSSEPQGEPQSSPAIQVVATISLNIHLMHTTSKSLPNGLDEETKRDIREAVGRRAVEKVEEMVRGEREEEETWKVD